MKKHYILAALVLALTFIHQSLQAQNKYLIMGDKAYASMQFIPAIDYYTKALSNFAGNPDEKNQIIFKQADCYLKMNNLKKAENTYQRLIKSKYANKKPLVLFYCAQVLTAQGKYSEALPLFEQFLKTSSKDVLALAGKESCELSLKDSTVDKRWTIRNMKEINSSNDDFNAVYGDSQFKTIFFSSNRKTASGKEIDNWTGGAFSDIFVATKNKADNWAITTLADKSRNVNTEANEGSICFDEQYNKLYFTRCSKFKDGKEYCQILQTDWTGNEWGKSAVIYTDSHGNVGQPAVTADGLTMIFASNRPAGSGAKDLWKCTRTSISKPFGPAENLGGKINTPGDEVFPTIFADTVVYFASNGRAGFGGLDIYRFTLRKKGTSSVTHLPRPVNSFADDFSINFEGENERGFFTSRRSGGKGGDDIYTFEKINWKATLKGMVRDEISQKPLAGSLVFMLDSKNDTIKTNTDSSGEFLFGNGQIKENTKYKLMFSKENYFSKSADVKIGILKGDSICTVNMVLQPIPDKPIPLPDIYYELNKWDLLPQYQDSLMLLVTVLNDNPKIVIELASHTDSRASDQYNDELSQKRAETVVSFITSQGINKERLVAKGYGKRMPRVLATDIKRDGYTFDRGTKLTEGYVLSIPDVKKREVAYQLNRRTEFSVIGKNFK